MDTKNSDKAKILIQALPYIQKYFGKVVVIKYGGNAMINDELKEAVISDLVLLSLVGIKVVLVHGGGPEISCMLKKMGKRIKICKGTSIYRQRDDRCGADGFMRKGQQRPCLFYRKERRPRRRLMWS